ncbi:MAG: type II secretion system F family protein [Gammaproteobacteria bacterium]|nr:type II secretion system F family protein [Gammaproteobacteria bacterium]MBL4728035.1 type II secretion system F family protein [Gammaproteobacteria bacterium]
MSLFSYKAIDSKGRNQFGKLDASNESDLEARLARMGMDLIKCKFVEEKRSLFGGGDIRRIDLINFCFHMEQLTRSGVSIIDGLVDLRDSVEQASFRRVIGQVIDDIEGGMTLSKALGEHPKVFDDMFSNLIAAGEESGQLPDVFLSLNEMIKWHDELINTTKKLLIFPVFVGAVVMAVVGFLMIYLVPQLVSFIEGIGQELPTHTKLLIATSNFFVNFWYLFTLVPLAIWIAIKSLTSVSYEARYQVDAFKLRAWQIGPVLKKIILSRFANLFAMLYKAGIPVLKCIEITERAAGNEAIRHALSKARDQIQEGKGVSISFRNTGLFPPLVIRMIKVGEATGQLDNALLNVSYFYERDIKDSIDKVQAMIQPAMTVVLGAILGWVMLSVMGPVYSSISNMAI